MKRYCPVCGKVYQPLHRNQKYCSKTCSGRAQKYFRCGKILPDINADVKILEAQGYGFSPECFKRLTMKEALADES